MAVTPNYSWPVPVDTDLVKDGAEAIKDLGDAIDATVFGLPAPVAGLTLIKTQVIGSAATTVNVTGAFSATYNNYRVIVGGGVGSTNNILGLKLGSTTTGYYQANSMTTYAGAAAFNGTANAANFARIGALTTINCSLDFDLQNPFSANYTIMSAKYLDARTNGESGFVGGFLNDTTSYTDFTLVPAAGNLTGGTIRVYGYQN